MEYRLGALDSLARWQRDLRYAIVVLRKGSAVTLPSVGNVPALQSLNKEKLRPVETGRGERKNLGVSMGRPAHQYFSRK
jgi:hypothetical protein